MKHLEKEHILIIEDDADIREGIRILLESENYTVSEAGDGRSGLETMRKDIDLVILDVMMPGLSGIPSLQRNPQLFQCTGTVSYSQSPGSRQAYRSYGRR